MLQIGAERAVVFEAERHAGDHDPVEEPLEDRRRAETPGREHEHQPLGGFYAFGIGRGAGAVFFDVEIIPPFVGAENRIEIFRIEIQCVHFVSRLSERFCHTIEQSPGQTVGKRMGIDDQDTHGLDHIPLSRNRASPP